MDPSSDPFPSSLPGYDSPHIFDSEMGGPMQDGDLEFFNSALAQESPGQFFRDDSLTNFANSPYQSPVSTKIQNVPEVSKPTANSPLFSASPESSSQDSSSDSSGRHKRKSSSRSSHSGLNGQDITMTDDPGPNSWKTDSVNHGGPAFGLPYSNIPGHISYEFSNRAMENDFDFDSAASSPSPNMNSDVAAYSGPRHIAIPYRASPQPSASLIPNQQAIKRSQEISPMANMIVSGAKPPAFLNSRSSPSSFNEEYIDGNILNGMEQLSTWPYGHQTTYNYPGVMPPTNYPVSALEAPSLCGDSRRASRQRAMLRPCLTVHPTPHKSRVETQIPIKLTLHPMPQGVTKLHLPTHTISKPKLLAKPTPPKSPDMLELYTMLVCTSAMQDSVKMQRAFARAAQPMIEVKAEEGRRSSAGDALAEDDENRPLNGGEVNICAGCITRERKRAARKKSKKPEEEEIWQKDEAKRIIVFNTTEVKDWQTPVAPNAGLNGVDSTQAGAYEEQVPVVPEGAMQIDVPMRIACYCRHQNEKLGFQVIFTIKNSQDNLVAQAMTNPIIITDDHKTHAPPTAMPPVGTMFVENAQVPGGGIFTREPLENYGSAPFRTAHSTPDLQKLQQSSNPYFGPQIASPFAVPQTSSQNTSATLTPHNLSRQASPSAPTGPNKKRKASGLGKLPDGLIMTRLQTQQSTGIPNQSWTTTAPPSATSAATSPFSPNFPIYNGTHERAHGLPPISRPSQLRTGPPTPTNNDMSLLSSAHRSQSLENLSAVQQMFSPAHSTRPSRTSSPVSAPHSAVTMPVGAAHPTTNSLYGLPVSSNPTRTPTIHKLIPSEGTKAGGIEVTCLGSGFCQGLEVMFGDSLATTTTYWGETSLVCLLPPALRAGTVPVTFKHHYQQHQMHGQRYPMPKNQVYFKYIDDDEQEILRHALALVHQKMTGRIEDAGEIARRIINNHPTGPGTWGGNLPPGNDQQRQMSALQACLAGPLDLEAGLLRCLDLMDLDDSPFQAQLNSRRANGQSILHLGASLGFHRLVAGLLARGANPDLRDKNGMSPMHMAALNGHPQIVRRLRVAGGDPFLRSLRGFTPADMATSQGVYDAVKDFHHIRSRSAGARSVSNQSRSSSSVSLKSLWVPPTIQPFNADDTLPDLSDDSSNETDLDDLQSRHVETPAQLWSQSRRTSVTMEPSIVINHAPEQLVEATGLMSPAAAMNAWRDHLAAQIQHFQQSVNWTLPNLQLPTLPPMPNLPDYQTYPMVRRFSALVPQRNSRPSTSSGDEKENDHRWWDLLTGAASSPPAYEEIYPAKQQQEDLETKQASVVQAATDALLDQKCSDTFDKHQAGSSTKATMANFIGEAAPDNNHETSEKRLRSDRKLFFVWIPLLVLVMVAMLKDRVPQVWCGVQHLYDLFQNRHPERIVEVF